MNIEKRIKEAIELERKEKNKIVCKKYYQENKTQILKKACEKVVCDNCGRKTNSNNLVRHQRTSMCEKYGDIKRRIENENQCIIITTPEIFKI
jgi:hypothetical protein